MTYVNIVSTFKLTAHLVAHTFLGTLSTNREPTAVPVVCLANLLQDQITSVPVWCSSVSNVLTFLDGSHMQCWTSAHSSSTFWLSLRPSSNHRWLSSRFQRESALRFITKRCEVHRVLIHLLFHIFWRNVRNHVPLAIKVLYHRRLFSPPIYAQC